MEKGIINKIKKDYDIKLIISYFKEYYTQITKRMCIQCILTLSLVIIYLA